MTSKIILCLLLAFIPTISLAQAPLTINVNTGLYESSQVLAADSIKGDLLYSRALQWVALNYKSANDVIQYKDAEVRKIIIKGNFPIFMFLKDGWIRHTLTLEFKDGRYRYIFSNFVYYSSGTGDMPFENKLMSKNKLLAVTNEKISNSINSIDAYLKKKNQEDNW
ncbi:DUF4468 domain-containing protein [Chitinophaga silvisoli]|uniref:DUF4468 domain-containing protein n=1 Tax=Chitinophaga silvisoli TaxID=2291814 RepID=A0A3E1NUH8_9BACT|nr:DUF4468 domain-containing protein [Chitinophaga silvisoli]RFM31602.1 DUF4468 domain-containing protein [Chitinophaga silvisoli]